MLRAILDEAMRTILHGPLSAILCGPALATGLGIAPATAADKPVVHIIATGGTIASTPGGASVSSGEVIAAVPGLDALAAISSETFADLGSSRFTTRHWLELRGRIAAILRERPGLAGIVITHGTDTLEETAIFLDRTIDDLRPLVLTGAMRPSGSPGADGPRNLLDAVRVAASGEAQGRGTLVVMNGTILAADSATKRHTESVAAFETADGAEAGRISAGRVSFHAPARARGRHFTPRDADRLPRVDIVHAYLDADDAALSAFLAAGAKGIVIATFGSGRVTPALELAAKRAVEAGIPVVMASRVGAGHTAAIYDDPGRSAAGALGVVSAGSLNPQKARVLLMLALQAGSGRDEIVRLFDGVDRGESGTRAAGQPPR